VEESSSESESEETESESDKSSRKMPSFKSATSNHNAKPVEILHTEEKVNGIPAPLAPVTYNSGINNHSIRREAIQVNEEDTERLYRMSLDIKCVRDFEFPVQNLYFQYSYPLFGSDIPVYTRPVPIPAGKEVNTRNKELTFSRWKKIHLNL
jgi:hypothetical protein